MSTDVVLRVVSSNLDGLAGREVTVDDWPAFVGRSDDCALVLKDARISRKHARLEIGDRGIRLVDAQSANGVFVGEARVEETWLGHEDRFRIGDTVIEVVAPSVTATASDPSGDPSEKTLTVPRLAFIVRIAQSPAGQTGKEVSVEAGFATIGRSGDCAIALRDDGVSRHHARIQATENGFRLVDLGSANGVWVGDEKVTERLIADGQQFRIGDTLLECELLRQPADQTPTRIVADYAGLMEKVAARRLEALGEPEPLGGAKVILLSQPGDCYYVVSGRVEIFTVTVKDGEPLGTRTHFLSINAGEMFFGFDLGDIVGSGFLATGRAGTTVRRILLTELRSALDDGHTTSLVGQLVEVWVERLAKRVTQDIVPLPPIDLRLFEGVATRAPSPARVSSAEGVVWVELPAEPLLFLGMSSLAAGPSRPGLFPLTPDTWLEPEVGVSGELVFQPHGIDGSLARDAVWEGLQAFHTVLRECEFINKRLAVVDEFQRLRTKARQSEAARDAAYDAIGGVLAGRHFEPHATSHATRAEPLIEACRLILNAQEIPFAPPVFVGVENTFEEQLMAVAASCQFRVRQVALRDDWWRRDQGPILGRIEATGAPIALIPNGPRAYDCVDPGAGTRVRLGPEQVAALASFGHSIYRPFMGRLLSLRDLLRFGARGLASDPATVVGVGVLTGLLGLVTPFLTGLIVDFAIPQGERALLWQFAGGMFLATVATGVLKVVQSFAVVRIETKLDYTLQSAVWSRLIDLPSAFFRRYAAGDLADRAMGINTIRGLVSRAGVSGLLNAISSLMSVGLMTYYSWKLALVAALVTLILVGATSFANYWQLRFQRDESSVKGRVAGLVLQLISGVAKVRVTAAENHAFRVWAESFANQKVLGFRAGRIQNVVEALSASFMMLASLVIFGVIYYLKITAKQGQEFSFTTGQFVAFYSAFSTFTQGVQTLSEASLSLLKAVPVYERLKPILEATPEIEKNKSHPGRLAGEISAARLSFRYSEDGPWILSDASFRIRPGEFVAIAGPSGCGKSTLLRLLLGFETPTVGALSYDGQDLNSLDLRAVRQQIGVVLQDSRVLPTDIYRNIVGATSRTMDEAWEAAEMAGLADDIRQMPMGMHTVVSEGGGTFSGGQKQRLLIARALVNKPKVIFFDEATSALDNRTQAVVTQSLDRMEATRVVIAHRLSTIVGADRILYLEGGQIREEGTYEELMAKNGLFAALAKRQIL